MEKHQGCPPRPDILTVSTQFVFAHADLLPANRRLMLDPDMRTVLLLSLEEEEGDPFFRTFQLPPTATPVFLALLQRYPHHCTHRELFAMLYPDSWNLDEHAWEQERELAIPLIRQALKSLLTHPTGMWTSGAFVPWSGLCAGTTPCHDTLTRRRKGCMDINLAPEAIRHALLPLQQITRRLSVRRIQASGVLRLKDSIERSGFLEKFPLTVTILDDGAILLIDGNHRLEAASAAGLTCVPCLIKANLTEQECYTLALQSNSAAETVVPSTLVTYTEFIKARSEHYTQMQIADMLGWSREKVKDYGRLSQIASEAWNVIGETFEASHHDQQEGPSPRNGEISPFTEWLLRSIIDLSAAQQLGLGIDPILGGRTVNVRRCPSSRRGDASFTRFHRMTRSRLYLARDDSFVPLFHRAFQF